MSNYLHYCERLALLKEAIYMLVKPELRLKVYREYHKLYKEAEKLKEEGNEDPVKTIVRDLRD